VIRKNTRHRSQLAAVLAGLLFPLVGYAQFSGNIQGIVEDPSGALVSKAKLTLTNNGTQVTQETTSGDRGEYKFASLAPGSYTVTANAAGFATSEVKATLETSQTLNLPVTLALAGTTQAVQVTGETPIVNTAETRNQLTLETETLSNLPLAGRNMISLVTLAPGAVGLGTAAGGSPGSGVDNYSTETQVDASANGQGSVGNMFIVDGLDITSAIRPGVLNLTPNPDSIQETSIQTNTFTVDYGRASSIQMVMTTKSGTDQFHGNVSDYFTNQHLWAGTEFVHNYAPFHSNNMSASIGGPIIPRHEFFFFFSIEPLWSLNSTGNTQTTFEDPAFTTWASQNYPNTFGTKLLTSFKPSAGTPTGAAQTAAQLFPSTCGTAGAGNIPCSLPFLDTGVFNATSYRNGTQWDLRIDKYFKKDRLYGTFYKTGLSYGNSTIRPAFTSTNQTYQHAIQVNETHTFSPTTLNEAVFGTNYVEGITPKTGLFSIPVVNVTGLGQGFGTGFAAGDFIQHNYHWRDVLTHIRGSHNIKAGYEGWFGDDVEKFQGPYSQPTFTFNNVLDLVQDIPYTESGVAYNPLTGKQTLWDWNAAGSTWGLFAQDTWQLTKKLTINYGVRWDDFGNAYSRSPQTVFANLYLGAGTSMTERVANGVMRQKSNALANSISNVWSPRMGIAWDPTGNGNWVIRGGAGVYHNWPTLANIQEEYRGNPPGLIIPTFYSTQGVAPVLSFGTSNTTPPFGYTYPALPPSQLDAHGGLAGLNFAVGAIDPTLSAPVIYNWAASVERKLTRNYAVNVGYSGSRGNRLLSAGGQLTAVSYGADINAYAGDLIQHNSLVPTRLNPSFGPVYYTANDRESRYNAFITSFNGRFGERAFLNLSYTRSASRDDTQVYPSAYGPRQWYGPSIWDAPNRFSLSGSYQLPGFQQGHGVIGHLTSGWSLNGTTIVQSGYPFTVYTSAAFNPRKNATGQFIGYAPGSGDFNADGDNYDYPNVTSYQQSTSRQAFLNGVFTASNFASPAFGTNGNEKYGQFRNPMFFQTDAGLLKDTSITERVKLQLRFEFFNLFNRANLQNVDADMSSGTFGKATAQYNPRWIQLGANLRF
jgi:Carboxypeptidase regulatory-like domain/TonB dependent receptor-like, beta-barrel